MPKYQVVVRQNIEAHDDKAAEEYGATLATRLNMPVEVLKHEGTTRTGRIEGGPGLTELEKS